MSIKSIRADVANFIRATFDKAQQQNTFLNWVAEKISAQKFFFYVPPEKSSRQQSLEERSVENVSTSQKAPSLMLNREFLTLRAHLIRRQQASLPR